MYIRNSEKILCEISEEKKQEILDTLEENISKVSESCEYNQKHQDIVAKDITASFGSILRTDKTTVTVEENRKKDGYVISAETDYKPSTWFWVFLAIDILCCAAFIGIVALIFTFGLYFYNKNLVTKSIADVLKNTVNELE